MSFVEEATLITNDKTSSVIEAINKKLMALRKTADSLKSIKMNFNNTVLNNRIVSTTNKFERLVEAANKASKAVSNVKLPSPRVPSYIATLQKQMAAQSLATSVKELHSIKGVRIEFDMPGLTAAMTETGMLLSNVRGLKKFAAIKLNVNSVGSAGPRGGADSSGVFLNLRPLQTMLHGFLLNLGYTIQNSIVAGFATGTTTQDVAESRLMFQGMTEEQVAMIRREVRGIVAENPQLSTPNATALVSEMLTTAQYDPTVAVQMAKLAAEMIKSQTILGMQPKQAEEQALGFIKSAETGGFLTDPVSGKYAPEKAEKYFGILKKSAVAIGQEFGSKMVGGFLKYAQTSKFPLDERGLIAGFLASEESGTSAGVGLNQAVKQLSGERITKKNLARMKSLGLITDNQIDEAALTGMSDEELTFSQLFASGAKNEEELRANFYGWVSDTVIPVMKKGGMDPNNPQDAARFAGSVTSDRTATNALAGAIYRSQEIEAIVSKTIEIDVSKERVNQVEDQSLTASLAAASAQFESVLGAIGNSFEGILIPALNATAGALMSLTNFIMGEDNGESSGTRSAIAIGGVGAAAIGTSYLAKNVLSFFNPLTVAGSTLTAAGTDLIAAASLLQKTALGSGVGSVTSTGAGAGAIAGGAAATSWFARASAFVGFLAKNAVPLLTVVSLKGDTPKDGNTEENRRNLEVRMAMSRKNEIERAYTSEVFGKVNASKVAVGNGVATSHAATITMSELMLKSDPSEISDYLSASDQMLQTFRTGANEVAAATKDSGTEASRQMLAAAPSIGAAIGQAAAAALSGVQLGVRQTGEQRAQPSYVPPARSDTGTMTPF